jgi:hypothetical protein
MSTKVGSESCVIALVYGGKFCENFLCTLKKIETTPENILSAVVSAVFGWQF